MNGTSTVRHCAEQLPGSHWNNRHTATIDWCEANYIESEYIAESWNSWSNIPFIVIALWGVWSVHKLEELPNRLRYILVHAGIAIIGVGSFIFHATLNWHAQVLLDEMPMIYVSTQALYCILSEGRPAPLSLKVTCVSIPLLVTVIYLSWPNPIFHQFSYAMLQFYTAYRVHGILKRLPNSQPAKVTWRAFMTTPFTTLSVWMQGSKGMPASDTKPTDTIDSNRRDAGRFKGEAERLLASGLLLMVLAFGFWNVDNIFCEHMTGWRQSWEKDSYWLANILTQGHATWHVLSSIGINQSLTAIVGITIGLRAPDTVEFAWKWNCLPYVRSTGSHKQTENNKLGDAGKE